MDLGFTALGTMERQALMSTFAQSRTLEVHGKRMVDRTFDPGVALRLHRKDQKIAPGMAQPLEFGRPNKALTLQLMNPALVQDLADKD
jgi:2-hydroxy-3-oxopropionate reductase